MEVPVDLGCSAGGARGREAALGPGGEGPLGGRVEDVSAAIRTLLINDLDALWCQARATLTSAPCRCQARATLTSASAGARRELRRPPPPVPCRCGCCWLCTVGFLSVRSPGNCPCLILSLPLGQ
nr:zinc finger protein 605 isoform X3 [Macaca fascicularis]